MPSPVHPYSDYGVALRTLRTARGWLGFLLVVCVLFQFVGFFLMYWTHHPYKGSKATWSWPANFEEARARMQKKPFPTTAPEASPSAVSATQPEEPFFPGTEQSRHLNIRLQWDSTYTVTIAITQLASLIAVSSQAIILFMTLLVVLVAQAPGVAQLTRSVIWSVLLLFMFLPWQFFARGFPIPGVIFGYGELLRDIGPIVAPDPDHPVAHFAVLLIYGRYILWPLIGLFVLLVTSERYRAGIMIAIGHPLQSMIQPRSNKITGMPPAKPGQLPPMPLQSPQNKLI